MAEASVPLFVADLQTLKRSVRLGKIVDGDQATPIINDAVIYGRTILIRTLTSEGVTKIKATATTAEPLTDEEVLRAECDLVESLIFRRQLLMYLPWATMDAKSSMPQIYNKEAPFRLTGEFERNKQVNALEGQINEILTRVCLSLNSDPTLQNHSCGIGGSQNRVIITTPDDLPEDLGVVPGQTDIHRTRSRHAEQYGWSDW